MEEKHEIWKEMSSKKYGDVFEKDGVKYIVKGIRIYCESLNSKNGKLNWNVDIGEFRNIKCNH